MSIYYIHGYGSSPNSDTFRMVLEKFPTAICLTYDPLFPASSLKKMEDTVRCTQDSDHNIVIASSLGGWYAEHLCTRIVADLVLYNPSLEPHTSLQKYGIHDHQLIGYGIPLPLLHMATNRVVILSIDDDVVPHTFAKRHYMNHAKMMYTIGGHRMTVENMNTVERAVKFLQRQLN